MVIHRYMYLENTCGDIVQAHDSWGVRPFFQGRRMFECVPSIIGKIVLTIGT